MASKTFPHVIVRDGWYHYHRRVPAAVVRRTSEFYRLFGAKPLFRRALNTNVYREALKRAAAVAEEFDKLVAEALADFAPMPTIGGRKESFSAEALAEVSRSIRDTLILEWRKMILRAEISDEDAKYLDDRLEHIIHRPGATDEMTQLLGMTPIEKARTINERWGFELSESSDEFGELVLAVKDGCVSARQGIQDIFIGKSLPDLANSTLICRYSRSNKIMSPTLRETVELYLKEKRVRPKTAREIQSTLDQFDTLIGNRCLHEISRSDFIRYIEELATKQIGGRSAGSIVRSTAKGTVQKRVGFLRTAINHAIEKHRYEGANPAAGFKISAWVNDPDKTVIPDKRPFKVSELNKVFEHPWFTGCRSKTKIYESGETRLCGSYYWVPILALFTGCRAAELGGLLIGEALTEDTYPHLHIRPNSYRGTKWDLSRLVPLLDSLMGLGFGDYVRAIRQSGADRLFPDWKPPKPTNDFDKDDVRWSNSGPVRKFNRHIIDQQLKDVLLPGARREVTFHSYRGAFKSMLGLKRHNVPVNVINEVVGHSKSEMDKRYVHTVPLEETYNAIRGCGWPDLVLPPPPPLP
jgi:integrase